MGKKAKVRWLAGGSEVGAALREHRPAISRAHRPASRMGKGGSSSESSIGACQDWINSKPRPVVDLKPREDFFWDDQAEPHATRRKQIIKAHPEVSKLYGHEWRSKYLCTFLLIIPQIWLSWATQDLSWPAYLFVAYVFGATITQALFLAIHELAHNLFFKSPQ